MNELGDLEVARRRVGDVIIGVNENHVEVTLDRPEVRNAINWGIIEGLDAAVEIAEEHRASVLTIRGAQGTFCSGADLGLLRSLLRDEAQIRAFIDAISGTFTRLTRASAVVVAVVEGYALAGGCELLLASDISVARDDAQVGDGHLRYSMLPGGGGSVRLPRQIADARAKYLLYTGLPVSGRQAADWGLVSASAEPDDFEHTVRQLITRLRATDPRALRKMKAMVARVTSVEHERALEEERAIFFDYVLGGSAAARGLDRFFERSVDQLGG